MAKEISGSVSYHMVDIPLQSLRKEIETRSPKDIVTYLDRNVIGQGQAKKTLAVAFYNHLRRINRTQKDGSIPKNNILMQGSTGSGKTFLLRNLADYMNVPIAICDASIITEAGFKGKNVEGILADLYYAANGDVAMAEKGIVYLDEFDKLSRGKGCAPSRGGTEVGVAVQRQMLKLLEGCIMDVPISGRNSVKINTENILFICGGAFVGLKEENINILKNPIGFRTGTENEKNITTKGKLTHQDFVEYGLIPEVVGRLPVIVELATLTERDLVNILLQSESSIIKSYQNLFKEDNVDLVFEEDAIQEIAHIAFVQNTGARGLNAVVDEVMEDIMFDLPSYPSIYRCIVTKQAVRGEEDIIIERQAGY